MFRFQVAISGVVLVWCLWQISVKDKDNRQDVTAYWSLASSLISYWFPSPTQQLQARSRKDD